MASANSAGAERFVGFPAETTTFVGRQAEQTEVTELIAGSRLVTLVGPGGSGKTRLATAAASRWSIQSGANALFVDLSTANDREGVVLAVAVAVAVPARSSARTLDLVIAALGDNPVLLVLDNCEHVVEEARELVVRLLRELPLARVLATSRSRIHAPSEACFHVPRLLLPEERGLDALLSSDAGRLFVDRARLSFPSFVPVPDDEASIRRICELVDGLPLGIELAAGRARALPLERLAIALDNDLQLLAGPDIGAPVRQRSLEASLWWSWALLDEVERSVLSRLSVFVGGFSVAAAQHVAGEAHAHARFLRALADLVEKALVVFDPKAQRYSLLGTVRQFSAARLDDMAEVSVVRTRHARWYAELASTLGVEIEGAGCARALRCADAELHNFVAAIAWCLDRGEMSSAAGIVSSLAWFWDLRGHVQRAAGWLDSLDAHLDELPEELARALLWCRALISSGHNDDRSGVASAYQALLAAARQAHDERAEARAVGQLGMLAMFFGESTGRELLECAIEITERTDDPFWTAYLAGGMTLFHQYADRHDLAKQPLERLHTVAFRLRNPLLEIFCCGRGAYLALAFGDLAGAATLIDDALRTEIANECLNFSFHAMHAAAELELCRGRPAEAHSALEELWRRFVRQGVHQFLPLVANSSARSLIAQGQGTTARRVLAAPWAHPSVQASTPHRIWLRDTLARAAWLEGDIATARAEAVRQCAEAADFGNVAMIGSAQMLLGAIARANDSPVRAAKAFRAALDAFVLLGFCPDAADALDELAGLHSDAGRAQRAVVLHTAAGVIRPHGCAPRFDRVVLYETDRAAARARLGATELARSEALGASLTLASAVRYAPSPVAARSACGWASLSTSERGVAELASAGLTNRSIAEQLGVTSETVKTQLSSVYRKVGVANRTQLAASWAASVRDDN